MTFDAREIADEAVAGGADPLAAVVTQLAGYASACWENLGGAGVFESERAKAAVESTLSWLTQATDRVTVAQPDDKILLIATEPIDEATHEQLREYFRGGGQVAVVGDRFRAVIARRPANDVDVRGTDDIVIRHRPRELTCPECGDDTVCEGQAYCSDCLEKLGHAGDRCPAAINIMGAHFQCDQGVGHAVTANGLPAHSSMQAQAIWRSPTDWEPGQDSDDTDGAATGGSDDGSTEG